MLNKSQAKAALIADRVMADLKVAAGQTERGVAARIKELLGKYNAKPAFRIIIASGKRSAIPHGFATDKIIKTGDLVVIDFGAVYNGHRSDITRTVVVGKPTTKQRKIFRIVAEAQRKAIGLVSDGRRCSDVDAAARKHIEKSGFGKYFIHSTGHGIGERVHQAPKISKKNRRKLKKGTVITIEPGIYVKGWGGVRIEDMVLVTKRGAKFLTKSQ